jgi:hypothetical protein
MMLAFDTPIPFSTMGRRSVSNVPAQALILMNDPFVLSQAKLWAQRVLAVNGQSPAQRITAMYESAFCRPPTEREIEEGLAFLRSQAAALDIGESDPRPWSDYAHVLINAKEFIFLN